MSRCALIPNAFGRVCLYLAGERAFSIGHSRHWLPSSAFATHLAAAICFSMLFNRKRISPNKATGKTRFAFTAAAGPPVGSLNNSWNCGVRRFDGLAGLVPAVRFPNGPTRCVAHNARYSGKWYVRSVGCGTFASFGSHADQGRRSGFRGSDRASGGARNGVEWFGFEYKRNLTGTQAKQKNT